MPKTKLAGLLAQGREFVGVDVAFDRQLLLGRPQILAEGQDVAA